MRLGPWSVSSRFFSICVSPSYLCVSVCPQVPELFCVAQGFCVCRFVFCVFLGAFVCLYPGAWVCGCRVFFTHPSSSCLYSVWEILGLELQGWAWAWAWAAFSGYLGPGAAGRSRAGKAPACKAERRRTARGPAGRSGALCPLLATVCPCNHCWVPPAGESPSSRPGPSPSPSGCMEVSSEVSSWSPILKTHLDLKRSMRCCTPTRAFPFHHAPCAWSFLLHRSSFLFG